MCVHVCVCAQDFDACVSDSACWAHLLPPTQLQSHTQSHTQQHMPGSRELTEQLAPITVVPDESAAVTLALQRPAMVDALIVFSTHTHTHHTANTGQAAGTHKQQDVGTHTDTKRTADTAQESHNQGKEATHGQGVGIQQDVGHASSSGRDAGLVQQQKRRRELREWLQRLYSLNDPFDSGQRIYDSHIKTATEQTRDDMQEFGTDGNDVGKPLDGTLQGKQRVIHNIYARAPSLATSLPGYSRCARVSSRCL